MILGRALFKLFVDRVDHRRSELLAAETVTSADDFDVSYLGFGKSRAYVEVKRFAERAGFFRTVEYGDFLAGSGIAETKSLTENGRNRRTLIIPTSHP